MASLSVGCSALFADDLAENQGATAGASGSKADAGAAGAQAGGAGAKSGGNAGTAGVNAAGRAGSTSGAAGQTQAGQAGAATAGGKGGATAGSGGGGAAGSVAGTGGLGGGGGASAGAGGTAGAAGIGGAAGAGGVGGQSGSAGASGSGGSPPNGGASGSSGAAGSATGGTSGVGGQGGTTSCPQLPIGVPSQPPACGNGVVDPGEECDVGGGTSEDGCSPTCAITCTTGVRVGNTCYSVSESTYRGQAVFDVPNGPGTTLGQPFLAELEDGEACGHLRGPTSHIAVLTRAGEREALAASAAFAAHLSAGLAGTTKNGSAWLAVGYRWLTTSSVSDPARWFWSEGGPVDASLWAPTYPKPESGGGGPGIGQPDGCGSINASLQLENHDCTEDRRPVLCEREPGCAMRAVGGGPWQVGYQGENGHCYLRLTQQATYDNAANACKNLGAHLAAFETIAELRALPGITSGLGDVWIGARRNACPKGNVGDAYVWATNGAIVPQGADDPGYWVLGEPNNLMGQEACATMTRNHGLNDEACSVAFRPLCERDY